MRAMILLAGLALASCSPKVIERIRTVEVLTPVAAPCPLPADVQPRPGKPSVALPDNAELALAMVMAHLVRLDAWADVVEGQVGACSQVPAQ
jgi:hypothetical protein